MNHGIYNYSRSISNLLLSFWKGYRIIDDILVKQYKLHLIMKKEVHIVMEDIEGYTAIRKVFEFYEDAVDYICGTDMYIQTFDLE